MRNTWMITGAQPCSSRQTWLEGLVDERHFPGVHWSFTREEALNLPSQAFYPSDDEQ